MFPEPTELLLIGYSIESIWTQKIQIKYIDTKNQLADLLTKGNFTRDEWNHLLCLFNISHFSSTDCSEVMSKRKQKESGEERVTAKSRPMMNLIARSRAHQRHLLLHQKARWKPNMKVKLLWVRKMRSIIERWDPKDATKDSDKHSVIWWMFMSSTMQASIFMVKNYSDNLHSHREYGTISQWNRCLTYLKSW